jgi:hypothetical protein
MKHLSTRIIIALATFLIGLTAFLIWLDPFPKVFQTQRLPEKSCSLSPRENKITELEAVELAECFVISQGYTAYPPLEDKSKLQYEFLWDSSIREEVLDKRRNLLESKAYGVRYNEKYADWVVVFRYNPKHPEIDKLKPESLEHLKTVGRAVTMDEKGGKMRIEHADFELSEFQRAKE